MPTGLLLGSLAIANREALQQTKSTNGKRLKNFDSLRGIQAIVDPVKISTITLLSLYAPFKTVKGGEHVIIRDFCLN